MSIHALALDNFSRIEWRPDLSASQCGFGLS